MWYGIKYKLTSLIINKLNIKESLGRNYKQGKSP